MHSISLENTYASKLYVHIHGAPQIEDYSNS